MRARRVVLTYHSHNISGAGYRDNDHVALATDLRTLASEKARIVSLDALAQAQRSRHWPDDGRLEVALTFDDGPRFDVADFIDPRFGHQKGFARIIEESAPMFKGGSAVCATSFVIASAKARAEMERAPQCGFAGIRGWLANDWWADAAAAFISIGNHSFDHVHPAIGSVAPREEIRGDFSRIAGYADADAQVRVSSDYILSKVPGVSSLAFAYPSGQVSSYLRDEYFPRFGSLHRCFAAFSTAGCAIDPDDSIWALPRFVCGWHWRTTEELRALIEAGAG